MTRVNESDALTPQRLRDELDEIAGPAHPLAILSEGEGNRNKRAISALAGQTSRRLDALYAKVRDALDDPDKLPRTAGKEVSLDRHGAVADHCVSARRTSFRMAQRDHDLSSRGTHDPGHHRRLD